jgi:hypothetical protein
MRPLGGQNSGRSSDLSTASLRPASAEAQNLVQLLLVHLYVGVVDRFFLGLAGVFDGICPVLQSVGLSFVAAVVRGRFEIVRLGFGGVGNIVAERIVTLAAAGGEAECGGRPAPR